MLTGLKVSSLTCKCVFYRPEHNAKGGTELWRSWDAEIKSTNEQSSKSRWEKWSHLSMSIYVYSQSYGH